MTDKLDRVAAAGVAVAAGTPMARAACAALRALARANGTPARSTGGAAGLRAIMAISQLRSCTGPRRKCPRRNWSAPA